MDGLPLEVSNYILSFIPYQELLKLRLVSKSFDYLIIRQFMAVNGIQAVHDLGSYDLSSISKLFQTNNVAKLIIKRDEKSRFLNFIQKRCPKLQILDIYHMYDNAKLSDLIKIGANLKYFRLWYLEMDQEPVDPERIFSSFPSLMAFDIHHEPVYPFCQKIWARLPQRQMIRWSSECEHDFNCDSSSQKPDVNCVRSIELSRQSNSVDLKSFAEKLEDLTLEKVELNCLYTLRMPNLKYLSMNTDEADIKSDLIFTNIFQSKKLRGLKFYFFSLTSSSVTSFLSLVHSLPSLQVLICSVPKVVKKNDKKKPLTFNYLSKLNLTKVELDFHKMDKRQFEILKSLLKCSHRATQIRIYTRYDQELNLYLMYTNNDKFLRITTVGPSNMRQLLDVFANQFKSIVDCNFSVKRGIDASFVETIVKFNKLKNLRGNFTEGFFKRWLIQAPKANIPKIKFNTYQNELHVMSNEAHDLLLESLATGQIVSFQSNWLCPNRGQCSCGLLREYLMINN